MKRDDDADNGNNTITPKMRRTYREMADDMMCAWLAHTAGFTFRTAKDQYGMKATGKPPGDYWVFAAARCEGEMIEARDRADQRRAAEAAAAARVSRPKPRRV